MERKLIIIRHGKSSWESIVEDINRPLLDRGVRNAQEMAHRLKDTEMVPEALYTSPANRAMHTAVIMAGIWETGEDHIFIRNKLYLPELEDIFETVYGIPDHFSSAAIFGHNPGFTDFANHFMEHPVDNVPTAGVVVVKLEMEGWNDLFNGRVKEVIFDFPKKLK